VSRFVTYPELVNFGIPYSRKHLLDLQKRGDFPRALQLSPNRIAWDADQIQEWVSSRPVALAVREPAQRDDDAGSEALPRFTRGPRAGDSVTVA
jgi:predicted DNA-binding transcriptional regulator AlpA